MDMEKKAASFETNVMAHKERLRGGGTRLLDEEKFRNQFVIKYPQLLKRCVEEAEKWEEEYKLKFLFQCNTNYNAKGQIQLSKAARLVLNSYKEVSAGSRISKEKALCLSDVFTTNSSPPARPRRPSSVSQTSPEPNNPAALTSPTISSTPTPPSTSGTTNIQEPGDGSKQTAKSKNTKSTTFNKKVQATNMGPLSPVSRNVMRNRTKRVSKTKDEVKPTALSTQPTVETTPITNNKKATKRRASMMLKSVVEKTFAAVQAAEAKHSPGSPRVRKTRRMLQQVDLRRQSDRENIQSKRDNENVTVNVGKQHGIRNESPLKQRRSRRKRGNMRELFALQQKK